MNASNVAHVAPEAVYVSVLSPNDRGELRHDKPVEVRTPERFFAALVEHPTNAVAFLIGVKSTDWADEEDRLVRELEAAKDKAARDAVKAQIPALVPARFAGSRRLGSECIGRQIVGHDFDRVVGATFEDACAAVRAQLPDRFLALHTTATERNADGTWRLRAYEILDREASREEWDVRVKPHMRAVGEHDPNALDVARLLYMPIKTAGYGWRVYEGARTKLHELEATPKAAATSEPIKTASTPVRETSRAAAVAMLAAVWPQRGNGRHAAQLALAGGLCRNGWSEADALEVLCDVCRIAGDEDRPKRGATIRDTWQRAARGEQFAAWTALAQHVGATVLEHARSLLNPDIDAWNEAAEDLHAGAAANDTKPTNGRRFEVVSASGLAEPVPPVDYVLRAFGIAPGRPSLLAGYGGGGKTILAQCLALHMAAGVSTCWGLPIATGPVLHIDFEMTLDPIKRRYQRLATAYELGLAGCALEAISMPPIYLSDADAEEALVEVCGGRRLCIIDNLAAATATALAKENESAIRKYLDVLTRVSARTGCTFLVLVHERKAGKDETGGLQRVRGSSAITDASGSVISISADGDGVVTLSQSKTSHRRKGEDVSLRIEDTDEIGNVTMCTDQDDAPGLRVVRVDERPVDEQEKRAEIQVLALLARGPIETKKKIETRIGGRKGRTGPAVDALVARREVVMIKGVGYCLDNAEARRKRVLDALAGQGGYVTAAQLGQAAHVDTDVVLDLERQGVILRSGNRFMVHPEL